MTSFMEKIRINQAGTIKDKAQAAKHDAELNQKSISVDDVEIGLTTAITDLDRTDLELSPRETVYRMLIDCKLDEQYRFKTSKGQGEHYVQAVRQVLSRTRKKALRSKRQLDEFKLLTISIETKPESDYDESVLVRSKQMSLHEASVYDELIDAFERKPKV